MSDASYSPPTWQEPSHESRTTVPAIVTYWLLFIWTVVILGMGGLVAGMVIFDVKIDPILLNMVSGLFGTTATLVVASVSYWVGATVGGKKANEQLGEANRVANATLARMGETTGTGAPPAPGTAKIEAAPDVHVEVTAAAPPAPGDPLVFVPPASPDDDEDEDLSAFTGA